MAQCNPKSQIADSQTANSHRVPVDLLVFGPHPDDLEIGLGGTIARHAAAGFSVGLCDVTAGELGSNGTPDERKREAAEAATRPGRRMARKPRVARRWHRAVAGDPALGGRSASPRTAAGRRTALLGRSTPRSWRRQPRARPCRVPRRTSPVRHGPRAVAARVGLLLLHQQQHDAVVRRGRLGALRDQARRTRLPSQPVRAVRSVGGAHTAHGLDVSAAHRESRCAVRRPEPVSHSPKV